jgi:hypothetical protein
MSADPIRAFHTRRHQTFSEDHQTRTRHIACRGVGCRRQGGRISELPECQECSRTAVLSHAPQSITNTRASTNGWSHSTTATGTPPAAPFNVPENLRRRIESTENSLDAMRAGRIKGMGYGPGPSDPQSVAFEIRRLERNLEEDRALLRMDRTKRRLEEAHQAVFKDLLPHGNGTPSMEAVAALDVANESFKAAKAKLDRLAHQLLDKPN